ncbi:transcription antitermination protein NusB-like [Salvia divinorum]|uniref:Transcription antitermination protein NusB-like n=1 Tax=Salvia divinorum TaxID=28513 RepID=A0ABD1HKG7_SALDI
MEAGFILSCSSFNPPKTLFTSISKISSPRGRRELLLPRAATIPLIIHNPIGTSASNYPRIDKSGKFCSPRAARELALMTLYAACLEGSDPVRLFEKRLNARKEIGYEFDRACLMEYDHMTFGGPPIATQTIEEADQILKNYQKESHIEAEVLSAPPKLVYSKLILLFTRKLLAAVSDNWESSVLAIDKVAPDNWKNEPAIRILEFSVLHLAMSEIAVLGTRHQIVINEAVDLAKRFCDGAAPRVINGCLRTFLKELEENGKDQAQNVSMQENV